MTKCLNIYIYIYIYTLDLVCINMAHALMELIMYSIKEQHSSVAQVCNLKLINGSKMEHCPILKHKVIEMKVCIV